jgi:hypothetical protein
MLCSTIKVSTLDGSMGDRNDPGRDAANETGRTIQNLCK